MKKFLLIFIVFPIFFLIPNVNFSQSYFVNYSGQSLEMTRNNSYLSIKFKNNTAQNEIERVYNSILPLTESRMNFRAGRQSTGINNVLIIELRKNIRSNIEAISDIENSLKLNNSVRAVGGCFVYNDKVLHFTTDEVIVKFKKNVPEKDIVNLNKLFKANIIEKVLSPGFENIYMVSIDPLSSDNVFDLSNRYSITQFVEFAQPNFIRSGMLLEVPKETSTLNGQSPPFMPNDTLLPRMWNIKNTGTNIPDGIVGIPGCDLNMEQAWDITAGNPNVLISITDTGIDTNHTDLRPNLCERSLWYDAYDNDQQPYDEYYHGTGVSGIAIAVGNNIAGMAGIAYNCRVMPVRVFGPAPQAFTTDLILAKGLNWSWVHGAAVINCSWGGGLPGSLITLAIQNAVNYGRNGKGTVVFGGSGNSDTSVIYPASMPEVIGVGGSSPCNERKSRFSCDLQNWGACYGEGMEIVAPCVYIGTTELGGGWCVCGSGTSDSSPMACGVGALIISRNINLSGDSVKMIIEKSARKVGNYSYNIQKENGLWNNEMGYGMLDAKAALDMTPPGTSEIYDQVPPILTLYPPESQVFNSMITVDAVITDNIGVSGGVNSPRLYYKTLQSNQLQVMNGSIISPSRYRFTFPVIQYSQGIYYYIAAQDVVTVPNFVTYPIGGSGVNPPGTSAPPRFMFVRNTELYDTLFNSVNVPIAITSERETSFVSILDNPIGKTVLDVDCFINVEHTFDADLSFSIISPSGTEIVLTGGLGWDGNNYTNTIFDDEAAVSIDSSAASPPFTGRYRPIDRLWLLDGENALGQWKLRVLDNGFQDGGVLISWGMVFKFSTGPDYVSIPGSFSLVKNYPNPFNPKTRIVFNVPKFAHIKITIYDVSGREVKTILNEGRSPALEDFVDFDASGFASGVYFYSMIADGEFIESKRMVLIK